MGGPHAIQSLRTRARVGRGVVGVVGPWDRGVVGPWRRGCVEACGSWGRGGSWGPPPLERGPPAWGVGGQHARHSTPPHVMHNTVPGVYSTDTHNAAPALGGVARVGEGAGTVPSRGAVVVVGVVAPAPAGTGVVARSPVGVHAAGCVTIAMSRQTVVTHSGGSAARRRVGGMVTVVTGVVGCEGGRDASWLCTVASDSRWDCG